MKLVLGVVDMPYVTRRTPEELRSLRWRHGRKPWQRLGGTTTTGDVAEILEARYGIMAVFADLHEKDVISSIEDVAQGKLDNLLMGGHVGTELFEDGDFSAIEHVFRRFLDDEEMAGRVPGVPTDAALRGVSHRLKHPHAKANARRPSFIDTGLYQSSFKVWVE